VTPLVAACSGGYSLCVEALLAHSAALSDAVDVPPDAIALPSFAAVGVTVATAAAANAAGAMRVYYEVELVCAGGTPQLGWATADFVVQEVGGEKGGVGDDGESWSADGVRGLLWHAADEKEWDESWESGDVIGLAADLTDGSMWVGKNGEWQMAFTATSASADHPVYPAISGEALCCRVRFGNDCSFPPPDESFAPWPQCEVELLQGEEEGVTGLVHASELPPSPVRGLEEYLIALGSGNEHLRDLLMRAAVDPPPTTAIRK
jgi:hypothetical protein